MNYADPDDDGGPRFLHTRRSTRIPRLHDDAARTQVLVRDHRLIADRAGLSDVDAARMRLVAAAVQLTTATAGTEAAKPSAPREVKRERDDGEPPGDALRRVLQDAAEAHGDAGLVRALCLPSAVADSTLAGVDESSDVDTLMARAFAQLTIPTAAELHAAAAVVPTLCALDDRALQGGLPCGLLFEIAGESGSGKSVLCLYMAAVCAAAHERPVTLVVTTGAPPAVGTLRLLCERVLAQRAALTDARVRAAVDRVTIVRQLTDWATWECGVDRLEQQLRRSGCGLLIVDSITALAATVATSGSSGSSGSDGGGGKPNAAARRSDAMLQLTGWLKTVADACRMPVVLTNLAAPADRSGRQGAHDGDGGGAAAGFASVLDDRAHLGVALHHAVNIRTFLERLPPPYATLYHVTKSPLAPAVSFALRYTPQAAMASDGSVL
eukprot:CAMPEP_0174872150 /NCGR_PEP_ID=MMETSP1114-20130205/72787_1 /TAXON_ID=312471 /ORGANISM="Neobodo designis, Strain CCAP 1951/1" /LENGTH=438 /DNA_ID=CAMNT_0016107445 /DNA_START=56 /DNA_END=1368 /DNA_ORIENTATION=-